VYVIRGKVKAVKTLDCDGRCANCAYLCIPLDLRSWMFVGAKQLSSVVRESRVNPPRLMRSRAGGGGESQFTMIFGKATIKS